MKKKSYYALNLTATTCHVYRYLLDGFLAIDARALWRQAYCIQLRNPFIFVFVSSFIGMIYRAFPFSTTPQPNNQHKRTNERKRKKSQTYTNFSIISSNSFATLTFSIPFTHSLTHVFRISNADTFTYISTGKKSSTNEKNIRAISSIFFFASHFIRMLYFSCEYNPTIWVWVENAIRYIVWNRFKMAVHKSCSFRLFEMSLKLGKMCFWLGCRKGSN